MTFLCGWGVLVRVRHRPKGTARKHPFDLRWWAVGKSNTRLIFLLSIYIELTILNMSAFPTRRSRPRKQVNDDRPTGNQEAEGVPQVPGPAEPNPGSEPRRHEQGSGQKRNRKDQDRRRAQANREGDQGQRERA